MTRPRLDGRVLSADRTALVEALRAYTVAFEENVHHLGAWMGLPASDVTALAEVIWAHTSQQPMSPARLAHRLGMSSGATTTLLNRLEAGGHVVRSRESSDRRVVTVRPSPGSLARAEQFFDASTDELHTLLDGFSDETARQCTDVVTTLVTALTGVNQRLRATPPQEPPAPRAAGAPHATP